jgi:hypothetical protein
MQRCNVVSGTDVSEEYTACVFCVEDGGDMLVRNVSNHLPHYRVAWYRRRQCEYWVSGSLKYRKFSSLLVRPACNMYSVAPYGHVLESECCICKETGYHWYINRRMLRGYDKWFVVRQVLYSKSRLSFLIRVWNKSDVLHRYFSFLSLNENWIFNYLFKARSVLYICTSCVNIKEP